jgi:SM-20-related protein
MSNFPSICHDWRSDQLCESIAEQGFALVDQAYTDDFLLQLGQECSQQLPAFRDAAIQNGVMSKIRSDHILWINQDLPTAYQHVLALEALGQVFNRAFFLGIKNIEAHFACYNSGEFYQLHRDNPQQKNHRVISAVLYLNQQWSTDWGGQLRLQDTHGQWHLISPIPNRLALFQSDLLHEVLPAQQQRLSITAWLRNDQAQG